MKNVYTMCIPGRVGCWQVFGVEHMSGCTMEMSKCQCE